MRLISLCKPALRLHVPVTQKLSNVQAVVMHNSDAHVTVSQDLESHLFGNPHSQHGWSGNVGSAAAVATARKLTLEMCNAPLGEYECVFTAGATGEHSSSP